MVAVQLFIIIDEEVRPTAADYVTDENAKPNTNTITVVVTNRLTLEGHTGSLTATCVKPITQDD